MSRQNPDQVEQNEDARALWERPAFRRLDTKSAEGNGPTQNEGNIASGGCGCHSAKNA
jgi:hypothetical protein